MNDIIYLKTISEEFIALQLCHKHVDIELKWQEQLLLKIM